MDAEKKTNISRLKIEYLKQFNNGFSWFNWLCNGAMPDNKTKKKEVLNEPATWTVATQLEL